MEQALAIEGELTTRFYDKARDPASEYETLREEYYKDLAE